MVHNIIISSVVLGKIQDPSKYSVRYLDRVRVKGRNQPIEIYEVMNSDEALIQKKIKTNAEFKKEYQFLSTR